jgi:hypothetical protein
MVPCAAVRLVAMSPDEKTISIQIEQSKTPIPLAFSQFRRVTLKKPIHPQEIVSTEQFADILGYRANIEYHLQLENGQNQTGYTVGYVEADMGCLCSRPWMIGARLQRVFLPRESYQSVNMGEHIGQVLMEQQSVTEQQVAQAANEQESRRNRKLG